MAAYCVRFIAPEPYLIFGNRYYVHKMRIDGSNYSHIPELHTFVHVIDIDDKVRDWILCITNVGS